MFSLSFVKRYFGELYCAHIISNFFSSLVFCTVYGDIWNVMKKKRDRRQDNPYQSCYLIAEGTFLIVSECGLNFFSFLFLNRVVDLHKPVL